MMIEHKKTFIILILLMFTYIFAQPVSISEIHEDWADYVGKVVTVTGIVTIGSDVIVNNRLKAYLQEETTDGTGKGIQIHHGNLTDTGIRTTFTRGNKVTITGTAGLTPDGDYGGARQITNLQLSSFVVESTGNSTHNIAVPLNITSISQLASMNGNFVKFAGRITDKVDFNTASNIDIKDKNGIQITMRIWNTTNINHSAFAVGDSLDVFGAVDLFRNDGQILPGYALDVIKFEDPNPIIGSVTFTPAYPTVYDPITVNVIATDADSEIAVVQLAYKPSSVANYTQINMIAGANNLYTTTIPAYNTLTNAEGNYDLRITAIDDYSNRTIVYRTIDFNATALTIADIVADWNNYLGKEVTVTGIVVIGADVLITTRLKAYLQDEKTDGTGKGIQIHHASLDSNIRNVFKPGNKVTLTGTLGVVPSGDNAGARQITSLQTNTLKIESTGHSTKSVAVPLTITQALNHNLWNGSFLKVTGTIYDIGSFATAANVNIRDASGASITLRVWNTTGINYSQFSAGNTVNVFAALDLFQSGGQLLPGHPGDLIISQDPTIGNVSLNPSTPGVRDQITIRANVVAHEDLEITSVRIGYKASHANSYNFNQMNLMGNNIYEATVPAYSSLTSLEGDYDLMITATDNDSNTATLQKTIYFIGNRLIRIAPKAYNVYENQKVEIAYYANSGDKVILRIYDSEGKLIATPINRNLTSNTNNYIWDGRDKDFKLVQPGLYICHIEVTDVQSGKQKTDKAPIVIGTRLR